MVRRGSAQPQCNERGTGVPRNAGAGGNPVGHRATGNSLEDFLDVSREQAVAYLEMALEAADAATARREPAAQAGSSFAPEMEEIMVRELG